ncbi:MAG: SDH family Clp fold serine proteinase [Nitrososphaerales archaeon]
MSQEKFEFTVEEEKDPKVVSHVNSCGSVMLSIVAPFSPLRVAPERNVYASLNFPDEFVLEDFIDKIDERYPDVEDRPPLHFLIHSLGGSASTSYITAKILRENFKEIVGLVPHVAASGATILALSCNSLVFGNISHLSGIDPSADTPRGRVSALSIVRAFDTLEEKLGTMTEGEISYPYRHLLSSITAEKYDDATHALSMVDSYTTDLMEKAGYTKDEIHKILHGVLYDVDAHEEVIMLDRAQELGIKAQFHRNTKHSECWKVARGWLHKYYLEPAPSHVIKYCLPEDKGKPIKEEKEVITPAEIQA